MSSSSEEQFWNKKSVVDATKHQTRKRSLIVELIYGYLQVTKDT